MAQRTGRPGRHATLRQHMRLQANYMCKERTVFCCSCTTHVKECRDELTVSHALMCSHVKPNPSACKDDRRAHWGSPRHRVYVIYIKLTFSLWEQQAGTWFSEVQTGRNTDGGFPGRRAGDQGGVPAPLRQQTCPGRSGFPYEVEARGAAGTYLSRPNAACPCHSSP